MAKQQLKRAWSVDDILKKTYKTIDWSEDFFEAFSKPQSTGVWFVWGESGSGKSSFILKLLSELAQINRIAVNDIEEADDMTVQDAFKRHNIAKIRRRLLWCSETMEEFDERISKDKAPKIIVINSWQYANMTFKQYLTFKRKHHDKLIIVISHVDGKQPDGRSAKAVMRDASLKIWVEGHIAFSKGRYIGSNGGRYIIWKEGAELYHGSIQKS